MWPGEERRPSPAQGASSSSAISSHKAPWVIAVSSTLFGTQTKQCKESFGGGHSKVRKPVVSQTTVSLSKVTSQGHSRPDHPAMQPRASTPGQQVVPRGWPPRGLSSAASWPFHSWARIVPPRPSCGQLGSLSPGQEFVIKAQSSRGACGRVFCVLGPTRAPYCCCGSDLVPLLY